MGVWADRHACAGHFIQQAQHEEAGGQYRPYALPWIVTGTVGVRLRDGRTVLDPAELPASPVQQSIAVAHTGAALCHQSEQTRPHELVQEQITAVQRAEQATKFAPQAAYKGHAEGAAFLQMQQVGSNAPQLSPPALPQLQDTRALASSFRSSTRPTSTPMPIPKQSRAAYASTALPAPSPTQHAESEESSSSPVDSSSSEGSTPPHREKAIVPALHKQPVCQQAQAPPQLLASDLAGLSFGSKLAAAWTGQLQFSALQAIQGQVQPPRQHQQIRCNVE